MINHYSIRARKDNGLVLCCATGNTLKEKIDFLNQEKYTIESCRNITTGELMEVEG